MLSLVSERLFNQPLLVTSDRLAAIVSGLGERFNLDSDRVSEQFAFELKTSPDSSSGRDKGKVETKKSTLIIPIYNTLVHRHGALNASSGYLTSYEMIGNWLRAGEANDEIGSIVLELDSGGGEAAGINAISTIITEMSKPVVAMVNEVAFSAAYWIASSADKIVITKQGGVGSIGAIAMHVDQSQMEEKEGLKVTVVASGEKKSMLNIHEPITKDGLNFLQERVAALASTFLDHVTSTRPQVKRASISDAGLFFGQQAVDAGLADEIGSLQTAVEMAQDMGSRNVVVSNGGPKMEGQHVIEGNTFEGNTGQDLDARIAAAIGNVVPSLIEQAVSTAIGKTAAANQLTTQINSLCKQHGMSAEIAANMIERGISLAEAKAEILDAKANESQAVAISTGIGRQTERTDFQSLWNQGLVARYGEKVLNTNPRALGVQRMLGEA